MRVDLAEAHRGTDLGREAEALLAPCVQCGQCTFICPTFRLLDDEWDGPRGRIYLIKQLLEGTPPSPTALPPAYSLHTLNGTSFAADVQLHLDRCLTCRSCEAACPNGVRYGRLLDIGRELAERSAPRPFGARLARRVLRAVVPYRHRFAPLLRIGQLLRGMMPPALRPRIPEPRPRGEWPAESHPRTMLVWQGCVQPALAPDINAAAARVLHRLGIRLVPAADGCCGAISQHLAASGEARVFMRRNIDALWPHIERGAEALVLTASGCGAHFRDYGQLLHDDPLYREKAMRVSSLVKDVAEVVTEEWRDGSLPAAWQGARRIAFQSSCSLQHAQNLNGVVETLLKRAGFKPVPVAYPFMCCGAAGTYSVLQRKLSESLRTSKLRTLMSCRPQAIATANIGCLTHLAAASPVPVHHWIELLDQAFAAADAGGSAG